MKVAWPLNLYFFTSETSVLCSCVLRRSACAVRELNRRRGVRPKIAAIKRPPGYRARSYGVAKSTAAPATRGLAPGVGATPAVGAGVASVKGGWTRVVIDAVAKNAIKPTLTTATTADTRIARPTRVRSRPKSSMLAFPSARPSALVMIPTKAPTIRYAVTAKTAVAGIPCEDDDQ